MARQFVLLRLTNMRGVDLDLFDFDFDSTWAALFLSADGHVYGRYGGRTPESAGAYLSLPGLRYALSEALARHQDKTHELPPVKSRQPPLTVEQYPGSQRFSARACIHCHNVYDFRREALQAADKWALDEVWVYPLPENVGLTVEADQGNRVRAVTPGSPAARVGLRAGDVLRKVNGTPIASFTDVQYALHRAPKVGQVAIVWERDGKTQEGTLELAEGWRRTDVSWRWSLKGLQPASQLHGEDLTAEEKQKLGLEPKRLAFVQGPFVRPAARHAGIQQNDVILGVDGRHLEMTVRQFDAYIRLNYRAGEEVIINVLRAGKRLDLPMKLPG